MFKWLNRTGKGADEKVVKSKVGRLLGNICLQKRFYKNPDHGKCFDNLIIESFFFLIIWIIQLNYWSFGLFGINPFLPNASFLPP